MLRRSFHRIPCKVQQLTDKLETKWRKVCGSKMAELFPHDAEVTQRKQQLEQHIENLTSFRSQLMSMRPASALPAIKQQIRFRFGKQHQLDGAQVVGRKGTSKDKQKAVEEEQDDEEDEEDDEGGDVDLFG